MESQLAPIGFEKICSDAMKLYIGFEHFEDDEQQQKSTTRVYPSDDIMPMPRHFAQANSSYNSDTNSHPSVKKALSHPELSIIYNEIMNEWSKYRWLTFADHHTKTYLTFYSDSTDTVTIQMAINQYQRTNTSTSLLSLPECLLIRTHSKTQAVFLPNSILSIENLCDKDVNQTSFEYKLMAIICHLNETNSKIMFHKNFSLNCWHIYYDQSVALHSHSNRLSDEEQIQMDSFVQRKDEFNSIDLTEFSSPLSNLCNHPIIYVYLPEENKQIVK
ncbi:hypothetical protein I4U23_026363 [Adineta vaga]|nr:hypothetical protein I4U23_026363 [Adineta vaga]